MGFALTATCLPAVTAAADRSAISIGLGAGSGRWHDGSGRAEVIQITYEKNGHQFALRVSGVADGTEGHDDSSDASDFGLLYGRVKNTRFAHLAVMAGLSTTQVEYTIVPDRPSPSCRCIEVGQYENRRSVGVPLVAEASFRPFPALGLGVQAFANLNRNSAWGAVVIFAQVGWMRH